MAALILFDHAFHLTLSIYYFKVGFHLRMLNSSLYLCRTEFGFKAVRLNLRLSLRFFMNTWA